MTLLSQYSESNSNGVAEMIFTANNFRHAMGQFLDYTGTLMPIAIQQELDKQRNEYEEKLAELTCIARGDRDAATRRLGVFVPDEDKAKDHANTSISIGIGNRIRGAIACYEAGNEVECARLLVLAQATIFAIIGMPNGSRALYDGVEYMHQEPKPWRRY